MLDTIPYDGIDMIQAGKALVKEFQTAMEQPDDVDMQWSLVVEESLELIEARLAVGADINVENMAHFMKEAVDLQYVTIGLMNMTQDNPMAVGPRPNDETQAVALAMEIMADSADIFLTDDLLMEGLVIVHASNMSKLHEDGKPRYADNGKVLKPDTYIKPDMTRVAEIALQRIADAITIESYDPENEEHNA